MCWNSSVSLNTFIIGLFSVLFAYSNNVITFYEALFYMSFISMQLIEYFAWKNLDNKKINKIISCIACILLLIQVPLLGVAYNKNKNVNYIIIAIYLFFILLIPFDNSKDYSISKSSNGHLQWNFLTNPIGIIIYLLLIYYILIHNKEHFLFIILLITLLLSLYTNYKSNTWGSVWCWSVNILCLYLIIKVFHKDFCTLKGTIL